MSIFSSIGKALRIGIGAAVGQIPVIGPAIGTAVVSTIAKRPVQQLPQVLPGAGARAPSAALTRVGALPQAMPAMSRLPAFGQGAVQPATRELAFSGGACPIGFHLDKRTRSFCVRNRRMNVLNGKAAFRAIRRIKGARKMLQKIERQLPRAKSRVSRSSGARHLTGPRHTE